MKEKVETYKTKKIIQDIITIYKNGSETTKFDDTEIK